MTLQQNIQNELEAEYKKFSESVYSGKVPNGLIPIFKTAVLAQVPANTKVDYSLASQISTKDKSTWTVNEAKEVISAIRSTPLEKFNFPTFEDAMIFMSVFQNFLQDFNEILSTFQRQMTEKKMTLEKLSGLNRSVSPMSIIAKA